MVWQRSWLNANDFFSVRNGVPRSEGTVDQYGFSLGGPIFKGKTFFLVDLEKVRTISKSWVSAQSSDCTGAARQLHPDADAGCQREFRCPCNSSTPSMSTRIQQVLLTATGSLFQLIGVNE